MQPDRSCYIRRAADERLLETIAEQRFAYVLAPRALGKSSLMGRAIRRLRADGQHAAVIDLTQIGSRVEGIDSARWHYSIAYRIVRELRLKVDLQAWWQDKSLLLSEQRLVEFFWDIVLVHTTEPVTIFFDDAERAIDLPFASELFAALHSCHMRRVSEPDYARLNFVVLGVAAAEHLCPDASVSPFIDGRAISLDEFSLAECKGFAPGFARDPAEVEILLTRIHAWTRGQPYLTQKLARAVARRGGGAEQIDAVVHELFLAPGISREEPLLSHMRGILTDGSPRSRQAVAILSRLGAALEVIYDPASAAQRLLHLTGIVGSDENGMLRFRNRIVERVFGLEFARSTRPQRSKLPAAVAATAALLLVLLLPYWYTQVLPRPYIDTLSFVSRDYGLALQAHDRLSRLPGFGARADGLLADAMLRRSLQAGTVEELLAADAVLRALPGRALLADELKARFWLRRAEAATRRGDRDLALINALAAVDGGLAEARPLAARLVGRDYAQLAQSFHLPLPPLAFEVDWPRDRVVVIDDTHRVERLPLESSVQGPPSPGDMRTFAERLTALQHVGVSRVLSVDGTGRAGAFELSLALEHTRFADLFVRLRSPSGAAAELELPSRQGPFERFIFTASAENGLARLADESVTGNWELTVFDRLSGETGTLVSWGLSFAGLPQTFDDEPVAGIALPDPVRTEQVDVVVARDGRTAVAVPSRPGVGGALSVWDLGRGAAITDIPIVARPAALELLPGGRVLVVHAGRARLWSLDGGAAPLAVIESATGFIGPPALTAEGDVFALGERAPDPERGVAIGLYRAADGERLASLELSPWRDWLIAPEARYLVTIDGSRRGAVVDPGTGELVAEFRHERELEKLVAVTASGRIVAVDVRGEIFTWPIGAGSVAARQSSYLGTTAAVDSIDVATDSVSFRTPEGLISVRSLADGAEQSLLEHGPEPARTRLSPDGGRLVTISQGLVRAWRLHEAAPSGIDLGDVSAVALDATGVLGVYGQRSGRVGWLAPPPALPAPTLSEHIGHRGVVTSLAVNATGMVVASGGSDGVVRIWSTATGLPSRFVLRHPAGPIGALALSADGAWLASAGPSSARIWALATGELVGEIAVDGTPLAVAIAPDASLVAVGDSAGNIFLAAPGGADGLLAVRGRSPVTALDFGRDSTRLASGGRDGHVVLWDTLSASPQGGAHVFPAPVRWLDLGEDAEVLHVASGSWLFELEGAGTPEPAVVRSRFMPDELRGASALARRAGGSFVGIGLAGAGRIELAELVFTTEDAEGGPPERDFVRMLGLALDPATGLVSER